MVSTRPGIEQRPRSAAPAAVKLGALCHDLASGDDRRHRRRIARSITSRRALRRRWRCWIGYVHTVEGFDVRARVRRAGRQPPNRACSGSRAGQRRRVRPLAQKVDLECGASRQGGLPGRGGGGFIVRRWMVSARARGSVSSTGRRAFDGQTPARLGMRRARLGSVLKAVYERSSTEKSRPSKRRSRSRADVRNPVAR